MTYSLDPKNPISFVQSGFSIFPKQKNLGFKIFQAVASNDLKEVRDLIHQGLDINSVNKIQLNLKNRKNPAFF